MERTITVLGSLQAMDRTVLSTQVSGRLKQLEVDVGRKVMAGEVLAQIEPREYELRLAQVRAQLAQARARLGLPPQTDDEDEEPEVDLENTPFVLESKARLDEAEKNLNRFRALRSESLVADFEWEQAQAAQAVAYTRHLEAIQQARERQAVYAQRRAEYSMAIQQVIETSLRSPFDGVVQARIANVGEFLSTGSPVLELVRINPLRLLLDIPERQAPLLQQDQTIRITIDGDPEIYEGRVARISPALNIQARMLRVEGELLNPGHLRPGAFVRAAIVIEKDRPTLTVPVEAITSFAGTEKAFLIRSNIVMETQVVLGRTQDGWAEVVDGLDPGDQVALTPLGLRAGMAVRPRSDTSKALTHVNRPEESP